jgi:integrase
MAKLTQLKVDRMRPPSERVEISDDLLPQLRLIVQPSGARSWAVRTRIHGKTAKLTIGDARVISLVDARDRAREILRDVAAGKDPRAAKQQADTLGSLIEEHLGAVAKTLRPRTLEERRRHLMRDWKPLHSLPLAHLNRVLIFDHMRRIGKTAGEVAAHRAVSDLSACISWAQSIGKFDQNTVNPAWRLPRLIREQTRARTLNRDELTRIWDAAGNGDYGAIVKLLMLLGARRAEVASMRWSELDLKADVPTWQVPGSRTKNGEMLELPLPSQAVAILQAIPRRAGRDLVFGEGERPYSGWSRSKRRLDRRCGVQGWSLHDLRRTLQSELHELGVTSDVTERILNHKRRGVQAVYDRAAYREPKRMALRRWADYVTTLPASTVLEFPAERSA